MDKVRKVNQPGQGRFRGHLEQGVDNPQGRTVYRFLCISNRAVKSRNVYS